MNTVMNNTQSIWLNPKQLEEEYGFSRSWQSKQRLQSSNSTIPFYKVSGKFILYLREEINDWIIQHKIQGS